MNTNADRILRKGIDGLSSALWKRFSKKSEKKTIRPDQVVGMLGDFLENPVEAIAHLGQPPYPAEFYAMLGELYGRALSLSGTKKSHGCFYTPISVARRLVTLIERRGGDEEFGFDPACGAGALLLAWVERNPDSSVVGWDLDPLSARLSRKLLTHFIKSHRYSGEVEIKEKDLFSVFSLDSKQEENRKPVLLFNPPFGSKLTEEAKAFSQDSKLAGREADPFVLGLEWALGQKRIERGGVIVPDVIRMQSEYRELRKHLIQEKRIRGLVQLPYGAFAGATVQANLLHLERGNRETKEAFPLFSSRGERRDIFYEKVKEDPDFALRLCHPRMGDLWKACREKGTPLGEIAACHEGVHTGNVRHLLFTKNPQDHSALPMLKGADVMPFSIHFKERYIRYDSSLIDKKKGQYASLRKRENFFSPKLVCRQTADRLTVARETKGYITDNSVHTIRIRDPEKWKDFWLLLYLNSSLATMLYRFQSGEEGRPLPQIKLVFLRKVPVPVSSCPVESIESLVKSAEDEARRGGGLSEKTQKKIDSLVWNSFELCREEWEI